MERGDYSSSEVAREGNDAIFAICGDEGEEVARASFSPEFGCWRVQFWDDDMDSFTMSAHHKPWAVFERAVDRLMEQPV